MILRYVDVCLLRLILHINIDRRCIRLLKVVNVCFSDDGSTRFGSAFYRGLDLYYCPVDDGSRCCGFGGALVHACWPRDFQNLLQLFFALHDADVGIPLQGVLERVLAIIYIVIQTLREVDR